MNYLKHYCNLIRKAENRTPPEGCVEKHHTFPKGIFGDNDRIVVLTPREHYIAHLLLEKICIKRYGVGDENTRKMTLTCVMMRNRSEKYNSHLYEQVRVRYIKNMKEKMKGEGNPSYGVPCSEEKKQKIREKHLGKKASQETRYKMSKTRTGKRRGTYLKIRDLEFREEFIKIVEQSKNKMEVLRKLKLSRGKFEYITEWIEELNLDTSHFTGNIGVKHTEQARENIRQSKLGEKNPFYGKKHTEETRKKMRGNNYNYGRKWWNDGCGNRKFCFNCPGEGWISGMGEKVKKQRSIIKWWNDGEIEKRSLECPEGWVEGRLKKKKS
jgi:hypothetical protein